MKIYRAIWWTAATLLVVIGVAAAALLWSIPTTLWIFACATVLTAAITTGMILARDVPPAGRELMAVVTTQTLVSATATVALFGFGALLGIVGIVLVMTVAASCPPAVGLYREHFERKGPLDSEANPSTGHTETTGAAPKTEVKPPAHSPSPTPVDCGAVDLDDLTLCREWSRSYWALCDTTPAPERLRIVKARQRYLDELERRHPGFSACWFAAGARPGSDPRKFLAGERDPSNPPDETSGGEKG